MSDQYLLGIKNFIFKKENNDLSISKAKKYRHTTQTGGTYLNNSDESKETQFLSENYIAKSKILNSGYGVFANRDYKSGDVVEVNRFLEFEDNKTGLENYVFRSHLNPRKNIIVLGNGSVFNHSDNNNLDYFYIKDKNFFIYKANQDISKGSEMYINYGKNWFDNKNFSKNT